MKRIQSVQVENSRMKGMLPRGCGLGDLRGSNVGIYQFEYIIEEVCRLTSCRCHVVPQAGGDRCRCEKRGKVVPRATPSILNAS